MTTDAGAAAAATGGTDAGAAAAAAAANHGANGGGFTAPEWLPGVDADTAKFITDATIKDLPSLAKTFVEQKRALSQPRGFEMPKEGDAEGLKKLHAALGVPEAADKYDFGDPGKGMSDEARKDWATFLHQQGVPQKTAQALVGRVAEQAKAYEKSQHEAYVASSQKEADSKLLEWGDAKDANLDLAKRGIGKVMDMLKIENTVESRDKIERAFGTGKFMDLGLLLGRQMVEAGYVVQDGQQRGMTKEGAAAELQTMMNDPATYAALRDRSNPQHARHMERKRQLEQIAHG